jgi:UMF1 family MFS transporter
MAIVCLLSPTLAGVADYMGNKKKFLQFFCYLGALSSASLFFFNADHLELSMLSVIFACIGFWMSYAFANSFLPEIALPEEQDKLSAKGFALGYAGSVILLLINVAMILGIGDHLTKWSFVAVGIWWAGFAQITFRALPNSTKKNVFQSHILGNGFRELGSVWNYIRSTQRLRTYLFSFFALSMGVQTIMMMAQFFGIKEIIRYDDQGNLVVGLEQGQLILAILCVQIIAIPGAYAFSAIAKKIGNIALLKISLLLWIAVCCFAYFAVRTPQTFFIAAGVIGFVMGGTQSLARSTYSKYLPQTKDHASFFSFYDVTEKLGLIIGLFSFGAIESMAGSLRASVLALIVFFIAGFVLLYFVPKEENQLQQINSKA